MCAAIRALSTPAASMTARRPQPGLSVSAAMVRALWLRGVALPRSAVEPVVESVTEGIHIGPCNGMISADAAIPRMRRQTRSEQLLGVVELLPGALRGGVSGAAVGFLVNGELGPRGVAYEQRDRPGLARTRRLWGCSPRTATGAVHCVPPPRAGSAVTASAMLMAAVRKCTRGLSGPTTRSSSGHVLTVTSPRAGASRSWVSAGHR